MGIVIFGAGGLGSMVLDMLLCRDDVQVAGFLDSDSAKHGTEFDGLRVLGGFEAAARLLEQNIRRAVVAVGTNADRVLLAKRLESMGFCLESVIHPLARIAPTATIGRHAVIGPRVSVCVHSVVGAHVVLSAGAIIDHDNLIGDGVFVHPAVRLAGGVRVEEMATIGIGASVIPGKKVGRGARVEPGAVVIRDVPSHAVVQGVPAAELGARGTFVATAADCATRTIG